MTSTEAAAHYQQMRRCAGLSDGRTADAQHYLTACSKALESLWAAQRAEAERAKAEQTREVGK